MSAAAEMTMTREGTEQAGAVLDYWMETVGPDGWYKIDEAVDKEIAARFGETWAAARAGELDEWLLRPEDALAFMIVLDQFPRNMFRGDDRAFATDRKALCAAKKAISLGHDLKAPEPQRQFFYLPLMHSESLMDQERCVRLILTRMPQTGEANLIHARAHRDVIRRFGRFPYRNDALGRPSTIAERGYLDAGGYAA